MPDPEAAMGKSGSVPRLSFTGLSGVPIPKASLEGLIDRKICRADLPNLPLVSAGDALGELPERRGDDSTSTSPPHSEVSSGSLMHVASAALSPTASGAAGRGFAGTLASPPPRSPLRTPVTAAGPLLVECDDDVAVKAPVSAGECALPRKPVPVRIQQVPTPAKTQSTARALVRAQAQLAHLPAASAAAPSAPAAQPTLKHFTAAVGNTPRAGKPGRPNRQQQQTNTAAAADQNGAPPSRRVVADALALYRQLAQRVLRDGQVARIAQGGYVLDFQNHQLVQALQRLAGDSGANAEASDSASPSPSPLATERGERPFLHTYHYRDSRIRNAHGSREGHHAVPGMDPIFTTRGSVVQAWRDTAETVSLPASAPALNVPRRQRCAIGRTNRDAFLWEVALGAELAQVVCDVHTDRRRQTRWMRDAARRAERHPDPAADVDASGRPVDAAAALRRRIGGDDAQGAAALGHLSGGFRGDNAPPPLTADATNFVSKPATLRRLPDVDPTIALLEQRVERVRLDTLHLHDQRLSGYQALPASAGPRSFAELLDSSGC